MEGKNAVQTAHDGFTAVRRSSARLAQDSGNDL
jgi:hypothetical protein